MEGESYKCTGCGSEIPASLIDFKTRTAHCPWCGLEVVFPKRHSTASPSAVVALEQATEAFCNNSYEMANRLAESALTMVQGHAGALFITSYYKAFHAEIRASSLMNKYFEDVFPYAEFDIEEEEMLKKLIRKTMVRLTDFEEAILKKFSEYDDPKELAEFVEGFSPLLIMNRTSVNWLTPSMAEVYLAITRRTAIPKTWYALYASIKKNPDSPLKTGQFFLKTKCKRIYEEYVLPIGKILDSIQDDALRNKFHQAYESTKKKKKKAMNC